MPYKRERKGKVQWLAEVRVMVHGRMVRRTRTFASKTEALKWELETKETLQSLNIQPTNSESSLVKAKEPTCVEWANAYLEYCQGRVTDRVWKEKKAALEFFFEGLDPELAVSKITSSLVLKKLQKKREKTTAYTANKDRKNLIAAWHFGAKYLQNWPQVPNPFSLVPAFPYEKQERYVPPEKDFWAVYDIMPEDDQVMLLCFLHTAARRNEIFSLKWSDVDFANKRIRLWTKKRKGGKEFDWVPMTEDLYKALLRHRGKYGQYEYVFVITDKDSPHYGKPYKSRQHWLKNWCERAKVKPFSFHCIRHLTASILDEKGIPLTTIQAILRHRSATTTARYLHSLRGAKVALDEVFARKPGKVIPFEKNKKASNE